MAVAFMISSVEAEVVRKLEQKDTPFMNGGLLTFTRSQLPAFIDALANHAADHDTRSEEARASHRLMERLGTWIGRAHVERMAAPEPVKLVKKRKGKELADAEPEVPVEAVESVAYEDQVASLDERD